MDPQKKIDFVPQNQMDPQKKSVDPQNESVDLFLRREIDTLFCGFHFVDFWTWDYRFVRLCRM